MNHASMKLPWPSDAVMIVAEVAGKESSLAMECKVATRCRHCKAALMADTHTIIAGRDLPARKRRPIDFFCVFCAIERYDHNMIQHKVDDRGWKGSGN